MLINLKRIILIFVLTLFIGCNALASDNVLQAIQISGVNDSYNIILKSDDTAEIKKTIQAPNKMMIVLEGIRASKTINTIYTNTSTVDSVVVEPLSNDSVKILIQATNVANAQIHFDSLKTPLGVLNNEEPESQKASNDEILLSGPMNSFRPVYNQFEEEETNNDFLETSGAILSLAKKALSNEKASWMVTFGLFTLLVVGGIKMLKGKENEIKIGLGQNLQQREIDMYRNMNIQNNISQANLPQPMPTMPSAQPIQQSSPQPTLNYGLKAYQNTTRSPYATPEAQRPRTMTGVKQTIQPNQTLAPNALQQAAQDIIRKNNNYAAGRMPVQTQTARTMSSPNMTAQKPKTANIDSMKFLESMTKIYEKNGRSDLAQGLKNNMNKAKVNMI